MADKSQYSFLRAFVKQLFKALDDDSEQDTIEALEEGLRHLLGLAADDTEDGQQDITDELDVLAHGPDESRRSMLPDSGGQPRVARGMVVPRQTSELQGTSTRGRERR